MVLAPALDLTTLGGGIDQTTITSYSFISVPCEQRPGGLVEVQLVRSADLWHVT